MCACTPASWPDSEIASLVEVGAVRRSLRRRPEKRSKADLDALYEWWLTSRDETFKTLRSTHDALVREQADIKARGTIAHVMQEKDEAAMAFILNRGEYDQRRDQVAPETPDDAAAVPRAICRATGWASPNGCCGPSTRSRPASR